MISRLRKRVRANELKNDRVYVKLISALVMNTWLKVNGLKIVLGMCSFLSRYIARDLYLGKEHVPLS